MKPLNFILSFGLLTAALSSPLSHHHFKNSPIATFFPNYIVPIKQASSNTAYPTQPTGEVYYSGSDTSVNETRLLVGFDINPDIGAGKSCAVKFQLQPKVPGGYQWTVTGTGQLSVHSLVTPFTNGVATWNNKPGWTTVAPQFTITQPLAGGKATVTGAQVPCLPGQRQDFEVLVTRSGPAFFDWYELNVPVHGIYLQAYN